MNRLSTKSSSVKAINYIEKIKLVVLTFKLKVGTCFTSCADLSLFAPTDKFYVVLR